MTVETTPTITETETGPRFGDGRRRGYARKGPGPVARRVLIVVVVAAAAAVATYFVSRALPPTYRSSTQLLVSVNESSGLGLDSVSAANQLTAQYVQLVPTDAALATPAAKLGVSVGDLRNDISAGTVAQQNLLQINATGSSASTARQRAATVTNDFISFLQRNNNLQLHAYISTISAQLRTIDEEYARLADRLRSAPAPRSAFIEGKLGALATQQQSLQNQITERATSGVPMIQLVHPASSAAKVAPRPVLYAIVALLVAGFLAMQLAIWDYRRRFSAA